MNGDFCRVISSFVERRELTVAGFARIPCAVRAAAGRREPPPPVRRTAYAVYGRARLLPILWGLHHVQHAHAPLLLRVSMAPFYPE